MEGGNRRLQILTWLLLLRISAHVIEAQLLQIANQSHDGSGVSSFDKNDMEQHDMFDPPPANETCADCGGSANVEETGAPSPNHQPSVTVNTSREEEENRGEQGAPSPNHQPSVTVNTWGEEEENRGEQGAEILKVRSPADFSLRRGTSSRLLFDDRSILGTFELTVKKIDREQRSRQNDDSTSPRPEQQSISLCLVSSCKGRCSSTVSRTAVYTCSCDDLCLYVRDCCMDYFVHCRDASQADDMLTVYNVSINQMHQLQQQQQQQDASSLQDARPNLAFLLHAYAQCVDTLQGSYYLVTSCPDRFANDTVKRACDGERNLPMSHASEPALVFKNIHCAQCHGYDANQTTAWRDGLRCSGVGPLASPQTVINAYRNGTCKTGRLPPADALYPPHTCSGIDTGAYRGQVQSPCEEREILQCTAVATSEPQVFAEAIYSLEGQSCLRINEITQHKRPCLVEHRLDNFVWINLTCSPATFEHDTAGSFAPGIVSMFDLSESGVMVGGELVRWPGFFCQEDEVYDHVEKACRRLLCAPGNVLLEGQCVRDDSVVATGESQLFSKGTAALSVKLRALAPTTCGTFGHGLDRLSAAECHELDAMRLQYVVQLLGEDFTQLYKDLLTELGTLFSNHDPVLSVNVSNLQDMEDPSSLCPDGRTLFAITLANTTEQNGTLFVAAETYGSQRLYPLENVRFTALLSKESSAVPPSSPQDTMTHTNVAFGEPGSIPADDHKSKADDDDDDIGKGVSRAMTAELCVSNSSSLTCPAVLYPRNRTRVENETLVVEDTALVFAQDEYEIHGDHVYVCSRFRNLNDFWSKLRFMDFTGGQRIIMLCLAAVSVLSLVAVLVVYVSLPELRTLPGKIMMCHVVCLLAGHVTLMVRLPGAVACRFVGASSHFVWLAAFAWTSALAFHMATTFFAPTARKTRDEADMVFRRYSAVCWGFPSVVVVTCLALDLSPAADAKPEYGAKVCGWIGNPEVIVWSFFLPLCLCLLINLLSFLVAVFGIERATRASSMAASSSRRRSEGRRLLVYVKMSAALGFTWMLGLGVAFGQWAWLTWVFAVLNSLQGAFISLAFLINERVLLMLKKKLGAGQDAEAKRGGKSTTLTTTDSRSDQPVSATTTSAAGFDRV